MTKWEYKTLLLQNDNLDETEFKTVEFNCENSLSNFGKDGWELVSVVPYELPSKPINNKNTVKMFLKRPVE